MPPFNYVHLNSCDCNEELSYERSDEIKWWATNGNEYCRS